MVKMIQTLAEFNRNVQELEASILPAKMSASNENGQVIMSWLSRNKNTSNGIDASVENLKQAVAALHRNSEIDWDVRPGTQAARARAASLENLKEKDPTGLGAAFKGLTGAAAEHDKRESQKVLDRCASFTKNARGQTHSKTEGIRWSLGKELERLLAEKKSFTFKEAEELERKLHVFEQGLH